MNLLSLFVQGFFSRTVCQHENLYQLQFEHMNAQPTEDADKCNDVMMTPSCVKLQ